MSLIFIFYHGKYILHSTRSKKKLCSNLERVLEINEYDTEALGLKLRVHQHFKENAKVIECCKKILEVDSDAYDVRTILNELEGK